MNAKKILALLLALSMVLSMAACGAPEAPAATEAAKPDSKDTALVDSKGQIGVGVAENVEVNRSDVHMDAVEAVGAMVAMVAAGTGRNYPTAAVTAVEGLFTGVGLIISLFVLFSLVFTIHRGYPPAKYFVSGYIIAEFRNMSMPQCRPARYSSA